MPAWPREHDAAPSGHLVFLTDTTTASSTVVIWTTAAKTHVRSHQANHGTAVLTHFHGGERTGKGNQQRIA